MSDPGTAGSDPGPAAAYWDDEAILAKAGRNPRSIRKLLRAHRQGEPTDAAIYQWLSRKQIARAWRPRLIAALVRSGVVTAVADLLVI